MLLYMLSTSCQTSKRASLCLRYCSLKEHTFNIIIKCKRCSNMFKTQEEHIPGAIYLIEDKYNHVNIRPD